MFFYFFGHHGVWGFPSSHPDRNRPFYLAEELYLGFERNIVITVDESSYGKRFLSFGNLKPAQSARRQYEARPDNRSSWEEYLQALQDFVNDLINAIDTLNLYQSREIICYLNEN